VAVPAATSTDTGASPISADPTAPTSPTPGISNDNSMIGEKVPEAVSTDTGKNVSSRSAAVFSTHANSNNEYFAKPVNKINPIVVKVMAFLLPLLVLPFIWKYRRKL
jgi:hypothetical protein